MAPLAELTHVTYWYPGHERPALLDVSLRIEPAEVILIVGGSGSGKSTLLRCLNGLVPHFHGGTLAGTVEVDGNDTRLARPRDLARSVGLVLQDPEGQAVMTTVEREIAFGLENQGIPSPAISRLVEEALILLGLSHLRHAELSTLSGGELQKVALAAVVATQPHLLLLDEPTSQLDPVSTEELLASVRRLAEDTGATIVLSEHRTERCLHFATRVISLDDGALVADAGTQQFAQWALPKHGMLLPPVARLFSRYGSAATADAREGVLPLTVKDARRLLPSDGPARIRRLPAATKLPHGDIAIAARKLTVGHDHENPLLENVNFVLSRGQTVAIMGENGVGKSTLVRHFIGLARPFSGKLTLLGRDVADMSVAEAAHRCAVLGQNPSDLFVKDTVAEEIAFTLHALGREEDEHGPLMSAVVHEFGLQTLLARNPRDLSGGEQTRVALAATVCGERPVLVLDEPTRGMDARHKTALSEALRRRAEAGSCVVVVTHDVEFAARLVDRVLILGDRRVLADGPTAETLDGSLFFSTQINRLLRRSLGNVLHETEVAWIDQEQ